MSNLYDFKNLSPSQRELNKQLSLLEYSADHQARRIAEQRAFAESEKYQLELKKQAAAHMAKREAELKAEVEKQKSENRQRSDAELRRRFFEVNPNELESTLQSLLPELRKQQLLENMKRAETSEQLMRQSGDYSKM